MAYLLTLVKVQVPTLVVHYQVGITQERTLGSLDTIMGRGASSYQGASRGTVAPRCANVGGGPLSVPLGRRRGTACMVALRAREEVEGGDAGGVEMLCEVIYLVE